MSTKSEAIVVIFEFPGVTAHQYDQVLKGLEERDALYQKERPYHVAAPTADGWLVVDVWTSAEAFSQFGQTLMPLAQSAGITPPQPRIYPVYNTMED
jgi:hypothetical protein